MRRLLGLRDLVHDAIDRITTLVEETHEDVARKPVELLSLAEPLAGVVSGADGVRRRVAGLVFDQVRGTNRVVRAIGDQAIALTLDAARGLGALQDEHFATGRAPPDRPAHDVDPNALGAWVDRAEGALNGVIGDFLVASGNPLATTMSVRRGGRSLPLEREALARVLPDATSKLCIFIHGLANCDFVWLPPVAGAEGASSDGGGADGAGSDGAGSDGIVGPLRFGEILSRELGYTSLYLRYNTGLHISENGGALAELLGDLVAAYPVDVTQIALVGHSMGGLVAQSASHYAEKLAAPWLPRLTHVLSIGSPHFGAPLARAGHLASAIAARFDTAATQVSAKVLRARSAGIQDLSTGRSLQEDWQGFEADANLFVAQRCPFVAGVAYGYVAARFRPTDAGPLGEWVGDLLVHVPSASGFHADPERHIPFHMGHVVDGAHHAALTTHPDVYRQLRRFLVEGRAPGPIRGA